MAGKTLPGSVFQRGDGRWVAQIRRTDHRTGKTSVVRRYCGSERDARSLLRILREGTEGPPKIGSGGTVAALVQAWCRDSLPVRGFAPTTVELYRGLCSKLLPETLGDVRLASFSPSEADRWLYRLGQVTRPGAKGPVAISVSRQRSAFGTLSLVLDSAVRDGLLSENPLKKVRRPSAPSPIVRAASPAEVETLLEACASSDWYLGPLVIFAALTGCRVGEALGLTWADVDLDRATATLRRSAHGALTTKTGRSRTVPLLVEVETALRRQRVVQAERRLLLGTGWPNLDLVFPNGLGRPMDAARARRQLVLKLVELGLPSDRPWHSLRHGLASRLLARDVSMPIVSALLGHSSIRVTVDTYGHVSPAMHAEGLARALGR